ncbi:MAG: hypothetical protein L3J28_07010 [Candidatus Polarisedimenticolaceae bacterium]|nr:hypothetical protein [Candidatus Polarisedimenticolaceae bacterium]
MAAAGLYNTLVDGLLLYDRGYPAFWLFAMHNDLSRHYCMRVPVAFNREIETFIQSEQRSALITLTPNSKMIQQCQEYNLSIEPITARVIRVELKKAMSSLIVGLYLK